MPKSQWCQKSSICTEGKNPWEHSPTADVLLQHNEGVGRTKSESHAWQPRRTTLPKASKVRKELVKWKLRVQRWERLQRTLQMCKSCNVLDCSLHMRWGMRGRGLSSTTSQDGALFAIDGPYVSWVLSLLTGPLFAIDGPYVYTGRHSCLRSKYRACISLSHKG